MADIPQGYREIPEEDSKKAKVFFDRGRTVAGTGNFDYAIEMYLDGLKLDPDAVEAHQALREISLKRKASGGKDLGLFEKLKYKRSSKDERENMLNAERLLAYDPGNTDHMVNMLQSALKGGFYDTVMWMGPILQRANDEGKSPDFNKFIILKNVYKDLQQWKLASDACGFALKVRPDDMDLQTEMNHLAAQHTMDQGKYATGKSFRDSIRDAKKQQDLLEGDKDIRTEDSLLRAVKEADAEYQADPSETGKLMKLVQALVRTEQEPYEARAVELLTQTYERTRQFRFRHATGQIRLTQLARKDRSIRNAIAGAPNDESLRQQYVEFAKARAEEEYAEYKLWSDNYPTDMKFRYEMAVRLFQLERYGEAIPVFQQARNDPKYRVEAGVSLGRAFLNANFLDEAADTLKNAIEEYPIKGDDRSKRMHYWFGRALEQKQDLPAAIKCYSQVAMWDFNYLDVQGRLKRLRTSGNETNGG